MSHPESKPTIDDLIETLRRDHPEFALELLLQQPEAVQQRVYEALLAAPLDAEEEAMAAKVAQKLRARRTPEPTPSPTFLQSILDWLTQALVAPRVATLSMGGHFGHGEETPELQLHATPDAAPRAVPLDHARLGLRAGGLLEIKLRCERPSSELRAALASGSFEVELLEKATQRSCGKLEAVVAARHEDGAAYDVDLHLDLRALGVETQKLGRVEPQCLRIHLAPAAPGFPEEQRKKT